MKRPHHEVLHRAWQQSGLTLEALLARSGLELTIVSLSRKLRGLQTLRVAEVEAVARALNCAFMLSARKPSRKRAA